MKSKEQFISSINNIPTLPTVYATLSDAIEDPRVTTGKLSEIISADQASAFKILKIANSSFYSFRGNIETISKAIFHLGFSEVRNIVFAISVMNLFSKDKRHPNFSPLDLWAHSIAVGIITRMIGEGIGDKKLENYFLAGILHDIGKIILLEYEYEGYARVLRLVDSEKCSMNEAETEIFGFDHTWVGFELAKKWKLPEVIQNTVLYHHLTIPGREKDKLVSSVYLANVVADMLQLGYSVNNKRQEPNIKIWDTLNIPEGFFTSIVNKMVDSYNQTIRIMLAG